MPVFNFNDNDGVDIGNKYVTKEYVMDVYPDLVPGFTSGELFTCGYNGPTNVIGQLGDNTTTNRSSPGTTAGNTRYWKQVSVSSNNMAAVKTDGTLWTWGANSVGQLGNSTTTKRSSPGTVSGGGTNWKQVSVAFGHMAAVKTDGTLWTWGQNPSGGLGTNNTTARSSPGETVGGGTNWKQVSVNATGVSVAIKSDGTLWTWGENTRGQLGDGTTTNRSSPGTTAGGGTNWKFVNCGYSPVCAIKTDGTLWTWGANASGQLGTNNTTARSSPGTTAGGGTNWKEVACERNQTAAIKTDGTLWTWGAGTSGALGTDNTTGRSSPGTTAGGGTNWKQVSCGYSKMGAIKTDGTLWTWGNDQYGSLGAGTLNVSRSSPGTTAGGGTTWKQIDYSTFNGFFGVIRDADF
jgi:alpha-tubulin suppressor-like RCC1 family protein